MFCFSSIQNWPNNKLCRNFILQKLKFCSIYVKNEIPRIKFFLPLILLTKIVVKHITLVLIFHNSKKVFLSELFLKFRCFLLRVDETFSFFLGLKTESKFFISQSFKGDRVILSKITTSKISFNFWTINEFK